MSTQLAIKEPAFFNRISQLVVNVPPDPLILSQFKNETRKHIKPNDVDDYLALGTLARLEKDIEAIHTNYQQAIFASEVKHAYALVLYAKCLAPFGLFSQAADLMHQAYNFCNNVEFFADTIHLYGLAGRFHQVGELLKTWDKVSPLEQHQFSQLADNVIAFMDKQQVSDDDLQGLVDIAMSILRQNQLTVTPEKIEIELFYGEELWFHYGIPLYEPMKKVVDWNFELADRSVYECPSQIIKGNFAPSFEAVGDE